LREPGKRRIAGTENNENRKIRRTESLRKQNLGEQNSYDVLDFHRFESVKERRRQ
jgi:hypothetical protein